ncbi:MAG: nitrogenase component 1 [Syntrophomonadaceae bacterium]|nr:nitrogenase component 1 [Syntrophomonadaceae bacterium]
MIHVLNEMKEDQLDLKYHNPPAIGGGKNICWASLRPGKKAINVIGGDACCDCNSEFSRAIAAAGIGPVRHISACPSFEEFCLLGDSSYNILIKADVQPIAEYIKKTLGIPYCYAPHYYGLDSISQNYCRLEAFLDVKLPTAAYREEAEKSINFYCRQLGAISLAVGEAANAHPFELARALVAYGFNVPYIFSDEAGEDDQEHIAWLAARRPQTRIFLNSQYGLETFPAQKLKVDLAIGLNGEAFGAGFKTIQSIARLPYGYEGAVCLLREMTKVMNNPHLWARL